MSARSDDLARRLDKIDALVAWADDGVVEAELADELLPGWADLSAEVLDQELEYWRLNFSDSIERYESRRSDGGYETMRDYDLEQEIRAVTITLSALRRRVQQLASGKSP